MAQENLRSFTVNGILAGLLITCLLVFAVGFMAANNPDGLNDGTDDIFNQTYFDQQNSLYEIEDDSNLLLNITANTNPEVSDLGSRDSVATSYSATGSGKSSWENARNLISWVFTGTTGKLLIGVFGGLIGILAFFFIVKNIRQGE